MKNKLIIVIGAVLLLLAGCDTNSKKGISAKVSDTTHYDSADVQLCEEDTIAFCPSLLIAIKSLINDYADDLESVVVLWVEEKDGQCVIALATQMCYITTILKGYQLVEGKMVAYYCDEVDDDNSCLDGVVDKSKLKKDFPSFFPDENSEFATGWDYDPRGRKYLVHSPDSLELIFDGCY